MNRVPRSGGTRLGSIAAVALAGVLVGVAIPPLWRTAVDNWSALRLLAALPALDQSTTFWRGAGLRTGREEIGILIARAYQASRQREGCTVREKTVLSDAVGVLDADAVRVPRTRMTRLAVARLLECTDRSADALQLLDSAPAPDGFDLQRVSFLQRLGAQERAAEIVLRYTCTSRDPWCVWSVLGIAPPHAAATIWRHSNDAAHAGGASLPQRIAPLDVEKIHNVTVTRSAAITATDAEPLSRDNYVQYQTIPVSNAAVRFRIRGAVVGNAMPSCLHPRLVLWSAGKYDGELELKYPVRDLFEVDFWAVIPARVTAVTPRITFDRSCLSDGRAIAIGAAEFASSVPAPSSDASR